MDWNRARVEALLTSVWGGDVAITRAVRLSPWLVFRCELESSCEAPASVIVKGLRVHPGDPKQDPGRVVAERVALELMAELAPGLAPRLLASDVEARLTVLEDLSPRVALDGILRGDNAQARALGLDAFARALGTLHARSYGHEPRHDTRRRTLGFPDSIADRARRTATYCKETCRYMRALEIAPSNGAEAELSQALAELSQPGFLVLSNGDAEANNYLVQEEDGRLIDFEFAGYRHALSDAACLYVPGPLWIRIGDPIATGLEASYRAALGEGVPQAADDRRFASAMAAACLVAALLRLNRFPRVNGKPPGDHSRLQMVSTLESASAAADAHHALPELSGWLRQIATVLRRHWPDADLDLGLLAPYTSRNHE